MGKVGSLSHSRETKVAQNGETEIQSLSWEMILLELSIRLPICWRED